jgi:alpha-methylacyl-CoA racemase
MTLQPLSGVRVLDFTAFPPGALCTGTLADLGAEVVRVDDPKAKGKPSLVFGQVAMTRGKRSMTLDIRNAGANDLLKRLAKSFDVIVENARPGAMEERGFGYHQAREANPKIIWCAITGFGQEGPYALHSGHDVSYAAHSGLLGALTPDRDSIPGTQISTPLAAMAAVAGIQAALLQRARSNEGAFVDISISEAAGWSLTSGINPLSKQPYLVQAAADRRLYECADGRFVAVASAEPRTWAALCDGLNVPDLKPNLHKAELDGATTEVLANAFKTAPAAEWVARLAPAGAAVTPVNHGDQLMSDPHIRERGSVVDVAGTPAPANPIRLVDAKGDRSATRTSLPPIGGADTNSVLQSAGFTQAEIDALGGAGLI